MKSALIAALLACQVGLASNTSTCYAADIKETTELRILAGTALVGVQKGSQFGERFKNSDIKNAFNPNMRVSAVLMRLTYSGTQIKQIEILVNHEGSTMVNSIKTLSKDDDDAKLLIQLLKL